MTGREDMSPMHSIFQGTEAFRLLTGIPPDPASALRPSFPWGG
jgi:hypothetical protein